MYNKYNIKLMLYSFIVYIYTYIFMLNLYKIKKNNINNNIIKQGNVSDEIKHYPSSTKEWFNSVYQYNKKDIKNLPSIDISVIKWIKSYFNMFSLPLEKSIRLRKKAIWRRRFKLNKILVGKPEFKHTNDKVTIILYVYNRELSIIRSKIKNLKRKVFAKYFSKIIYTNNILLNKINTFKLLISNLYVLKSKIKEFKFKFLKKKYLFLKKKKIGIIKIKNVGGQKKFLSILYKLSNHLKKIIRIKLLIKRNYRNLIRMAKSLDNFDNNIKRKRLSHNKIIIRSLQFFFNLNKKYSNIFENVINISNFNVTKLVYLKYFKYIAIHFRFFLRYYRIMKFNTFKLNVYIKPLKLYLEKIYKKNVSFNIISLKSYHLNSSILMQILSTKLRNRKNRVTKLLPLILSRVKIPITSRLEYFNDISRNRFLQNIVISRYLNKNYLNINPILDINSISTYINTKKGDINLNKMYLLKLKGDKLDMIIKSINPIKNILDVNSFKVLKRNYKNVALDIIPNKAVSGIRIEASGRLSKRLTAARSVYSMKQIGTIRNINSSYKKIPSVLLKGNLRSNVQFFKTKNKTRIGSFGLKGWVGSI